MAEMKVPKYSTKPTIGRIVIYNHPTQGEVPAIVQAVHQQGDVRLCVFTNTGPELAGAVQGDAVGQWSWPVLKEVQQKEGS